MTAPRTWLQGAIAPADATAVTPPPQSPPPASVRGVPAFGPTVPPAPRSWLEALIQGVASPVKDALVRPAGLDLRPSPEDATNALAMAATGPERLTGEGLLKLLKEGGGFTVDAATGKALTKGFSVGAGKATGHLIQKPIADLTPQELDQFLSKIKGAVGGWVDNGTAFVEPATVTQSQRKAFELARSRGEQAFGHLDAYARGQDGTKWIPQPAPFDFKHYSAASDIRELDPARYGTGPGAGRERRIPDRQPGNYVYAKKAKPEILVTQGAPYKYTGQSTGALYDLNQDPAGLMESMHTAQMERYLKKQGLAGYTNGDVAYLFDKTPVAREGSKPALNSAAAVAPTAPPRSLEDYHVRIAAVEDQLAHTADPVARKALQNSAKTMRDLLNYVPNPRF